MSTIRPGHRFGPYEVTGVLGAGGMGEVYLARDDRLGRQVAVKVLPHGLSADPDRLRRFEQEARASGVLNHPNIVTVFDVGTEGGQPYLVCELLDGETLRDRLRRAPITPRDTMAVGVQAARGLAAAHARGIVHRDLKPENLFLTRDGLVKLLDFGIAKLVQPEGGGGDAQATVQLTERGVVMGTASYMSPEQVAGGMVDHRSDVFSLGTVLYEMLAGERPFTGETPPETMTAILRHDPEPVGARVPAVPAGLERIVMHCLEKSPEHRFQSARDLAFALEALTSIETPRSGAAAPLSAEPRSSLPRRAAIIAGPLVAAAGIATAVMLGRAPQPPTSLSFTRVTRLIATDASEVAPALSPDGKWVTYISDAGGRTDVWVRFLSGDRTINLTGAYPEVSVANRIDIGGLDISPDGAQIVFDGGPRGSRPGQMAPYVIPAPLGGTPRKLLDRGRAVRWSPDGGRLAYMVPGGSAGDAIWVADATGEHARELLPVSGGIHAHWPAWSADGQHVYFNYGVNSSNLGPTEIWRVPVGGGPAERVIATSRRAVYPCPMPDGRGLLYSSNPIGVELALFWKPPAASPVRVTTGVGEYAEPRISRDGRTMVATAYTVRESLVVLPSAAEDTRPAPLVAGVTGDLHPVSSPSGDRIAFSSARGGDRNIWTARPDGTEPRMVTAGAANDERPAWSPDGRRIAFVSSRGGRRGLWVTDAEGGIPRHLHRAAVLDTVTWSPDGTEIIYAAPFGPVSALFAVPVAGGPARRIPTPAGATAPSWSPVDPNVIAYIEPRLAVGSSGARTQVAFVSPAGQVVRPPLTVGPSLANGTIAWSPDGRALAAVIDPGAVQASVWVLPLDGAPHRLIEFAHDRRPRGVTWAPDGTHVIIGLVERSGDIVLFDQGP